MSVVWHALWKYVASTNNTVSIICAFLFSSISLFPSTFVSDQFIQRIFPIFLIMANKREALRRGLRVSTFYDCYTWYFLRRMDQTRKIRNYANLTFQDPQNVPYTWLRSWYLLTRARTSSHVRIRSCELHNTLQVVHACKKQCQRIQNT